MKTQIEKIERMSMVFENSAKAEEQLSDVGYYRLSFYWKYFKEEPHKFKTETQLSTIFFMNIFWKLLTELLEQ